MVKRWNEIARIGRGREREKERARRRGGGQGEGDTRFHGMQMRDGRRRGHSLNRDGMKREECVRLCLARSLEGAGHEVEPPPTTGAKGGMRDVR